MPQAYLWAIGAGPIALGHPGVRHRRGGPLLPGARVTRIERGRQVALLKEDLRGPHGDELPVVLLYEYPLLLLFRYRGRGLFGRSV